MGDEKTDVVNMIARYRPFQLAVFLGFSLSALVGCDRLKSAAEKVAKIKDLATPPPLVRVAFSADQVTDLAQADFPNFILRKNALVIVDFHAEWCGPCKMMGPVLAKAAKAHPGVVYVGKVNVDLARDLAAEQGVGGIPDVRIYKAGKQVDRMVGFPGEAEVLGKIASLAVGIDPPVVAAAPPPAQAKQPEMQPLPKQWMPPGISRNQDKATQHP